jgi:hypothetical protein
MEEDGNSLAATPINRYGVMTANNVSFDFGFEVSLSSQQLQLKMCHGLGTDDGPSKSLGTTKHQSLVHLG